MTESEYLDAVLSVIVKRMEKIEQVVLWLSARGTPPPALPCTCGHGLMEHDEREECSFPRSRGAPAVLCPCTDFQTLEADP